MFLRIKKIDGKEYGYVVENFWRKKASEFGRKGARQKVKGYLGRVYAFSRANESGFFEYLGITDINMYFNNNENNQIIHDLIKWEFFKHEIEGFIVDLEKPLVTKQGRNACIKINEGILCSYTLKNLIEFSAIGEDEREVGIKLAKGFIEAGINVPKEVFVELFGKMSK